jgi:opacity protein-like surface antigen
VKLLPALALCLALGAPAFAQTPPSRPAQAAPRRPGPPRVEPGSGYRVYFTVNRISFAARRTFDAVLGTSALTAMGGGGEYRFWKGLFVRGAISTASAEGSRAFIVNEEVVPLGIPLRVRLTPVEIAAGWRYVLDRSRRYVAYGGGGLIAARFSQTSDFADSDENTNQWFNGYVVSGGIDVRLRGSMTAGAEVQYRTLPDALGAESIGEAFEENDLGGFVLRLLIGIRK